MAVEQGKLKTPEENYEDAAMELALYRMLQRECDGCRYARGAKPQLGRRRYA